MTAIAFAPEQLDPELREAAEYALCQEEFSYWFEHYGVADIREVGSVPMSSTIWKFQKDLAWLLQHEPRVVILKARQTGVSTIAMHLAYWLIRFHTARSQHILVLSKSKDDAAYLLSMVPNINNMQPPFIRLDTASDTVFRFSLSNGNSIECLAATEGGGRSRAATAVILDEHAFHRYAEKNWNAVKPTLEGGGHFLIISTGNGIGNLFSDIWEKAKHQESSFKAVFIPWWAPAHRDGAWYNKEESESPLPTEEFEQEYPENDVQAFTKSGQCPFDAEWIQAQILRAKELHIETRLEGRVHIFHRPEVGKSYVAGIDCAHGVGAGGKQDRTSLKIVDPLTNKHMASWDGKIELYKALPEIHGLLTTYFNPFLVVERNGPGIGMITALQALGYTNFYRFKQTHVLPEVALPKAETEDPVIGVTMSGLTKPRVVHLLIGVVDAHAIQSEDIGMWGEMLTFVQKGPTKWEASGKHKDDQVIAMGWAQWALAYRPIGHRRKLHKRVRWR